MMTRDPAGAPDPGATGDGASAPGMPGDGAGRTGRPLARPARVGRIAGALTAVATMLVAGLTLLVGLADGLPFVLGWFADATLLVLVMGGIATLGNLLVGALAWRSETSAAQRDRRPVRTWPLVGFVALTMPIVVYVVAVIITQPVSLVLLIGLLLVCLPAAALLAAVARLLR
ncbi:hypothetical protein MTQ12_00530 [Brevibacterium sp. R8603A2]|uniref:hypothetical protein n=1 Tax=Brevibacterium sp. R8603A2 TaxID=2929779 RepID=UPI001FF8D824|nr:hypothetical protein [Brevibacterium sp. R8603A2]MCK1801546.1 hypothetical protein [Brevibacterium sp. R8603A2]